MRKLIILISLLLFFYSCSNNKDGNNAPLNTSASYKDTITPPHITIIANLRDSLQPQTIFLDKTPPPITKVIPAATGKTYTITNGAGVKYAVKVGPPVRQLLPVLRNAKGEIIKDKDGNPFMMGNGGMADFTNFTTDNGLAVDDVLCSLIDKDGNIWFGTDGGGVCRYDGTSFTTFSIAQGLANNEVRCIAQDKKGNLWFGTYGGGVSCYDGRYFKTFTTAQGLANNIVMCIAEDKTGDLWFGTSGGASKYDGTSFKTFSTTQGLVNNAVWSIINDKKGNLWLGTKEGVSRYDGRGFTNFSVDQGLSNNMVYIAAEDRAGNIWFGTRSGVSKYDGTRFTNFSIADGLANNNVWSIVQDRKGNMWFGTKEGVSRFDGRSFTTFTAAQGLAYNGVNSIVEDKAGNLLFGTGGGGVSRYNGPSFTNYFAAHGLINNSVYSIAQDRSGNLWFAALGGVSCFDGRSFTNYSMAQGIPALVIQCVFEDKTGNTWFGTDGGGVCRFDGKSLTTFSTPQGLPNKNVVAIAQDKNGNIWFGTAGGGVSRFDGKSFTTFSTAQGLANNNVRVISEDKSGNLWFGFGSHSSGTSRYDGKSFINFNTAHGLSNNEVYSIAVDKTGNIWFGTENGLNVISSTVAGKLNNYAGMQNITAAGIFRSFTKTDGLPDNEVSQVLQLPNGKMAIGTNLGITLFRPSQDVAALSALEIYNVNTGCPVKDVNAGQNCMYADSSGVIWAPTGSQKTALVRFDPSALYVNTDSPKLVIKSIKINETHICWYDLENKMKGEHARHIDSNIIAEQTEEEISTTGKKLSDQERTAMQEKFGAIQFDSIAPFYPIPGHLVLPYRHNNITIDFDAIETDKPTLVNYQYILDGYDNEWSPVMKKTTATFSNIGEGTYTFRVKAQGPNGVWCEPVIYNFRVLPPWYRTWWAYLIYALLFLLALRIFIKTREHNLRLIQENLERTVVKRTNELVQKNIIVEMEKQRSDELLLNILPEEVATELKSKGSTTAKYYDNVTVMFTDFVNFTNAGANMSPQELVDELHTCFKAFDVIVGKYNIEKIKTVGDAYLAVAGLPTADPNHAENIINAAIEIRDFMSERHGRLGKSTFRIRIGINTGSVVAGVVGVKKFAYDIWGDTVNTAARMEQKSEAGKINISQTTYDLVKDKSTCIYRGEIDAKGKGELSMYFVK